MTPTFDVEDPIDDVSSKSGGNHAGRRDRVKRYLAKADSSLKRAVQTTGKDFKGHSLDSHTGKHQLPWMVIYCGANPKVEQDIASVCGELGVEWTKEYFGAW
ncbi:unnamed protein product [Choristocarpus tenellus]